MALRFIDGFDHYTWAAGNPPTGDLLEKWTGWAGSGGGGATFTARNTSVPRNGSGCAQLSNSNLETELYKTLDDQGTWIVGWGWRVANNTDTGWVRTLRFLDSSGGTQASVYWHASTQKMALYRGDGTTWLAETPASTFANNTWFHLEVKLVIANAGGSFELKVNGVTAASYSGDTQQHASITTAREIRFCGDRTQTGTTYIDDVHICDGTGSGPDNDFLGDCKVETRLPNGNGNSSQLVGNDGNSTDNYLLVDEAQPDDVTTYVESSNVGDKDTYTYQDLATASGTVYGVQICPNAQKSDAGSRSIAAVARLSGTEEDSSNMTLTASWKMFQNLRTTKPGGGTWSISDVNSAEFGVKVTA